MWRRLLVRSDSTIADLHTTLQLVMGGSDEHLHRFVIHGKDYRSSRIGGIGFSADPHRVRIGRRPAMTSLDCSAVRRAARAAIPRQPGYALPHR